MKNIFYLVVIAIFTSCNSQDEGEQYIHDTAVDLSVVNSEGQDLLDPEYEDSYNEENIKLAYIVDGEEVEVFNGNLDHPKGFFIFKVENDYRMRILPNINTNEEFPETFIRWNETDIDTLKCSVKRTSNSTICTKVWLNGEVVWEAYETERYFEITK